MRRVFAFETSSDRVEMTFRAFREGDLEMLASYVNLLALEQGKRRDLCLVCRSRRSADAVASIARGMFSHVVWKRTANAREVLLRRFRRVSQPH